MRLALYSVKHHLILAKSILLDRVGRLISQSCSTFHSSSPSVLHRHLSSVVGERQFARSQNWCMYFRTPEDYTHRWLDDVHVLAETEERCDEDEGRALEIAMSMCGVPQQTGRCLQLGVRWMSRGDVHCLFFTSGLLHCESDNGLPLSLIRLASLTNFGVYVV